MFVYIRYTRYFGLLDTWVGSGIIKNVGERAGIGYSLGPAGGSKCVH